MVYALILSVLLSGCAYYPVALQPATKPLAPGGYTPVGKVSGEDCAYRVLYFIPVTNGNELHQAMADAMRTKPLADAMVEVTVDYYVESWILFTRHCTQVHGTAVQTKDTSSAASLSYGK